jgi:hypothetical protein
MQHAIVIDFAMKRYVISQAKRRGEALKIVERCSVAYDVDSDVGKLFENERQALDEELRSLPLLLPANNDDSWR